MAFYTIKRDELYTIPKPAQNWVIDFENIVETVENHTGIKATSPGTYLRNTGGEAFHAQWCDDSRFVALTAMNTGHGAGAVVVGHTLYGWWHTCQFFKMPNRNPQYQITHKVPWKTLFHGHLKAAIDATALEEKYHANKIKAAWVEALQDKRISPIDLALRASNQKLIPPSMLAHISASNESTSNFAWVAKQITKSIKESSPFRVPMRLRTFSEIVEKVGD